jgi:hypothetical protein
MSERTIILAANIILFIIMVGVFFELGDHFGFADFGNTYETLRLLSIIIVIHFAINYILLYLLKWWHKDLIIISSAVLIFLWGVMFIGTFY